jgi:translation initiation factor IF-3
MNEQIKENIVQLVMDDGEMRGQTPKYIALELAAEKDLDLVQVAPSKDGKPPICKLMDYGKIKYKESKGKKKQAKQVTKEIKFKCNIDPHDMETKVKQITKFLSKKYNVRYTLELRGRYRYMKEMAREKFDTGLKALEEIAQWDKVNESNNNFSVTLKPLGK